MADNPLLDSIIARETYAAMLDTLTPKQLSVTALRLDGLTCTDAALILGLSTATVNQRMKVARRRLETRFPHVKTLVRTGT